MIRSSLLERIQPHVEALAEQLVDMLLERISLHMNQLELALDAATSAFASDLSVTDGAARQHDVRDEHNGNRRAAQPRSRARRPIGRTDSAQVPTETIRHHDSAADRAVSESSSESAADLQDSSYRALQQGQDLPPSTSPSRRICGCALRGPHRKSCSMPNVSTSPASAPTPATTPSSPATSPISKPPAREPGRSERMAASSGLSSAPVAFGNSTDRSNRFAKIESAAQKREALARARDERARSFIRKDGIKPTRSPQAQSDDSVSAEAEAEANPLESVVSTFQF